MSRSCEGPVTLPSLLIEQTRLHPNDDFLIYADRNLRFTYTEFLDRVNRLAKGLHKIGISKGDHVGIWANNIPDWIVYQFATARIGAVLVTINTNYKSHELEYLIRQADLKAILLIGGWRDSDYLEMLYDLVPELKTDQRGHLQSTRFPCLKQVIFLGHRKHRGLYTTSELLLLGETSDDSILPDPEMELHPDDVINMQYTSGTTGFPKGVMLTHANIIRNGWSIGECQKFTSDDKLCLPVPLFHCFGCVLGVLAILTHGGSLAVLENFDAMMALATVEKEGCTALYGVPTMFIAELAHPMFDLFKMDSLRTGIMAGSSCPMETMKQVIERMHCTDITIAYGLTEASPVITQTTTDDPIELRVDTVGRALPGIEVELRDPETGLPCQIGETGEICCRGYNVMKGYYNMPEATLKAIEPDGWLHSGDLGTVDENGYYRVTGRIKDMIIRGGENIYPREIENFLMTHPSVLNAQVVGVPSPKYGEQVAVFVMNKEGVQLTEEDIRDFCRGQIARFKIPKFVFFVDAYPQTASGKIRKYKLREQAVELLENRRIEVL